MLSLLFTSHFRTMTIKISTNVLNNYAPTTSAVGSVYTPGVLRKISDLHKEATTADQDSIVNVLLGVSQTGTSKKTEESYIVAPNERAIFEIVHIALLLLNDVSIKPDHEHGKPLCFSLLVRHSRYSSTYAICKKADSVRLYFEVTGLLHALFNQQSTEVFSKKTLDVLHDFVVKIGSLQYRSLSITRMQELDIR